MSLIGWIVLLFVLAFINLVIGIVGIKGFLSQKPSIRTRQDLEAFKKIVRKQMYQTIVQIGFLGAMSILGLIGIISGRLSCGEFLLIILFDVIILVSGKYGKKFELQARSLAVEDETLQDEYTSVCKTWVKKPFPDF